MVASATVMALPSTISGSLWATSTTAFVTSDSFPTPEGSIRIRSGWNCSCTLWRAAPKSPTREQQMQPEFISEISMPASLRNPPSMPISPNSFSIRTTFSPWIASSRSFLIKVVFPAPKKPEITSIFVICYASLLKWFLFRFSLSLSYTFFRKKQGASADFMKFLGTLPNKGCRLALSCTIIEPQKQQTRQAS